MKVLRRLPTFRNAKGEIAHSKADGSDWTPAQWLQAIVGELGEYANVRNKYERGDINKGEFLVLAAKELADVQIYLDLLCYQYRLDLSAAVICKFNEVSERVDSPIQIKNNAVVRMDSTPLPIAQPAPVAPKRPPLPQGHSNSNRPCPACGDLDGCHLPAQEQGQI